MLGDLRPPHYQVTGNLTNAMYKCGLVDWYDAKPSCVYNAKTIKHLKPVPCFPELNISFTIVSGMMYFNRVTIDEHLLWK